MTGRPLSGVDAQIFDRLAHVISAGRHHGTGTKPLWTQADVARVCVTWLTPRRATDPQLAQRLADALARADHAERRVRHLAAQLAQKQAPALVAEDGGTRVVELFRRRAEVLTLASQGKPRDVIAVELGITVKNVRSTLSRAAQDIGAVDPKEAVELVATGRIDIRVKSRKGKAA